MMFVVVFLSDAKKHIIVPQEFVFGLSQQSLNNVGKNRNRQFLVFWSKKAVCAGSEIPDSKYKPNFGANVSKTFPPIGRDEACFTAQIKYFYGKYQYLCVTKFCCTYACLNRI